MEIIHMRAFILFLIGFLAMPMGANAQQRSTFISPKMAFSRELFPKPKDSVQILRLTLMGEAAPLLSQSVAGDTHLPAGYDWSKDVRLTESLKRAAFLQNHYDARGRWPAPDTSNEVMQRVFMKNTTTH